MSILTAVDLTGIQRFVFGSNRLRDVAGASELVLWATERDGVLLELVDREQIIGAAGGNALLRFDSRNEARTFAGNYSRLLLDRAPGLEAAIVHREFESGDLARSIVEIGSEMRREKFRRLPHGPLIGIGVTAACRETGLMATPPPAKAGPRDRAPLAQVVRKRRATATDRWDHYLPAGGDWAFPLALDDLGREWGDRSLLGVVHIDANGVGRALVKWLDEQRGVDDASFLAAYDGWSEGLRTRMSSALAHAIDRVIGAATPTNDGLRVGPEGGRLGFRLAQKEGHHLLPIRPILLGGDDLTFVCDGRIALDLAVAAMGTFPATDPWGRDTIGACAGVAVVPAHHPFARAYELSQRLCESAKVLAAKDPSVCALDWHLGAPAPGQTIKDLRRREYADESLTCRPYRLKGMYPDDLSWELLTGSLLAGLTSGAWRRRRGKAKALAPLVAEAARAKSQEDRASIIEAELARWAIVDPKLTLPAPLDRPDRWFGGGRTPVLDAVELIDVRVAADPVGQRE